MDYSNYNHYGSSVLKRFGWKEGKGLGKNENGVAEPIKASYKFNNYGIGFNHGSELTNTWWDEAYKAAASRIVVENTKDGVTVRTLEATPVATKQKGFYSNFVKSATIYDGQVSEKLTTDSPKEPDEKNDVSFESRLLSQEAFEACGKCTAHKAARHGMKMNGKLQRLYEQEQLLLQRKNETSNELLNLSEQNKVHQQLRKKRKRVETKND